MTQTMLKPKNKDISTNKPILEIKGLKKHFNLSGGGLFQGKKEVLKAVDGINFSINEGETFGLVGESGCGKSTTGNLILRLLEATDGEIFFEGKNILEMNRREMLEFRKKVQVIFQDPYSSLNPRMKVGDIVGEPLSFYKIATGKEKEKRVQELFEMVGLAPYHINRYPHEFSGGQRQRIGIARALTLNPKLIICDEPVSALDVSIQAQILNLLSSLQKELGMTYLFIAHGLPAVKFISDKIGVMYLGKIVETASSDQIYTNALHPYTEALISAIPIPDPELKRERIILEGDVPSPINPPIGCRFHTRCPIAESICKKVEPELKEVKDGHFVACHLRS